MFKQLKALQKLSQPNYSKYRVSAILETDKGFFEGVNVEPSVMNLGICAERNALFASITKGSKKVKNIYLLTDSKNGFGSPCGACRQLLVDYIDKNAKVYMYNQKGEVQVVDFFDLLPYLWTKKELKK